MRPPATGMPDASHPAWLFRLSELAPGLPYYAREVTLTDLPPYGRDFVEIMAIASGRGILSSRLRDGRTRTTALRPGIIVFFRPFDVSSFRRTEPGGMATYAVSLAEDDWAAFARLTAIDPARWNGVDEPPLTRVGVAELEPVFTRAIARFHARPDAFDLARFLAEAAPLIFPTGQGGGRGVGAPPWLAAGLAEMRQEENLRVGLPRLRRLAHVTAPHLSATVRRYHGTTPTALVRELRLNHAAMLLSTTPLSVQAVAARCGFGNVPYFATAFRRLYGVSPREYRLRSITAILLGEQPVRDETREPG